MIFTTQLPRWQAFLVRFVGVSKYTIAYGVCGVLYRDNFMAHRIKYKILFLLGLVIRISKNYDAGCEL
jgi:hypothetical protein